MVQTIGRLGEIFAEAELIARGWKVGNFNASTPNAAAWDLFAAKDGRSVKLRVKCKAPQSKGFRWSAKPDGAVFLDLAPNDPDDYVLAVSLKSVQPGHVAPEFFYVIPTQVVHDALTLDYEQWIATPRRDGTPRKVNTVRAAMLGGSTKPQHGYSSRWGEFLNAWDRLEPGAR